MQRPSRRFALGFLLLGVTLTASKLIETRKTDALSRPLHTIPASIDGWIAVGDQPLGADVIRVLHASSYLSRSYRKGEQELGLFVAYYAEQRAGVSMHSPKHCLPGSGWEIWKYGAVRIPLGNGSVPVNEDSIQNGGERAVALYWYQSRSRIIANEYLGKIMLVHDALLHRGTAAALVRITLNDKPGALGSALGFASEIIPEIQRCLTGSGVLLTRVAEPRP